MMSKFFATALLLGLTLSASAETQNLHFELPILPGDSGYFYCKVQPTVSYVSFTSNNLSVTGFQNNSVAFSGANIGNILNQVYFTASQYSFTGSNGSIDVVYEGSIDDMVCYSGKGDRTIGFIGQ